MANYDDTNGVWRTIGGRRVFIREGKSLSEAMKESGKFKRSKKATKEQEEKIESTPRDEIKYALEHNEFDYARRLMQDYGLEDEKDEFLEGLNSKARAEFKAYDTRVSKKEWNAEASRQMEEDFAKAYKDGKISKEDYRNDNYDALKRAQATAYLERNSNLTSEQARGYANKLEKQAWRESQENKEVWKKQEDGTFKADKDAMAKSYEERHKKYDAKIKQLAEDREKMSNSDWEAQIMAYEKQDADGTYKTMQDIMDDVEEYSKKERYDYESKVFGTDVRKADEQMKKVFGENFRYAEEKGSTEEPKTFFDGKRDIEEEARQIYAEDGIMATSDRNVKYLAEKYGIPKTQAKQFIQDTAKRFDEENERTNKYNAYYKKEGLGEPKKFNKGDEIEFNSSYDNNLKGTIVREATDEEKRYQMNSNLKGYIVRDNLGHDHVVADTRIKKQESNESSWSKKFRENKAQTVDEREKNLKNTLDSVKREKTSAPKNYDRQALSLSNQHGIGIGISGLASNSDGGYKETEEYVSNLIKKNNSSPEAIAKALNNDKRVFNSNWKVEKVEDDVVKKNYNPFTNKSSEEKYNKQYTITSTDRLGNKSILKVYAGSNEEESGSNDWIRNAYNDYKKEHPKSKLTLADFTRRNKK